MISDKDINNLKKHPMPEGLSEATPLFQGLWVLQTVKDSVGIRALTAEEISRVLSEAYELDLSAIALARAFAPAGKKIKTHRDKSTLSYEIMLPGRADVLSLCAPVSNGGLRFLTGKEAWSDSNHAFPEVVRSLTGDLRIVDPFYGDGTLYMLSKLGKIRKIHFLTSQLGTIEQQNLQSFRRGLSKFKREFKNIEMRVYGKFYEMHDRYIIADNALVIIGHGIKDFAEKESFLVKLPHQLLKGILPILRQAFDSKWSKSNSLT